MEEVEDVCRCTLKKVGRIQFLRSIRSLVAENSVINVKIVICSEFNDPLDNYFLSDTSFSIELLPLLVMENGCRVACKTDASLPVPIVNVAMTNGAGDVRFKLPMDVKGEYSIIISIHSTQPTCIECGCLTSRSIVNGVYILPLISEPFLIVPSAQPFQSTGNALLGSYRKIPTGLLLDVCGSKDPFGSTSLNHIVVHEEYGATLGSHLYDSSIILLRYLARIPIQSCSGSREQVVVELGAGCGLVGLWFAAVNENVRVYLTDMICQRSLIAHNIAINGEEALCKFVELDWSSGKHASKLLGDVASRSNGSTLIDTLIATDVLYDREAARLLFTTIRRLATPALTRVFIAQKLRKNNISDVLHVDIRNEDGFEDVLNVYEEADVIVWSLKVSISGKI